MASNIIKIILSCYFCLVLIAWSAFAEEPPHTIHFQGMLADTVGTPLNGPKSLVFSLYDTIDGEVSLWAEAQSVMVYDGLFDIELGAVVPFSSAKLNFGQQYYLGIKVGSDREMTPRQRLGAVAYAFKAYDSDKLAGKPAADYDQYSHVTDMMNPHQVTPEMLGFTTDVTMMMGMIFALQNEVTDLNNRLAHFSVGGPDNNDIYIRGANLHIESGANDSQAVNGLGNLIIGTNEERPESNERSGSHNLIIGDRNNYSSYGGFVAGRDNAISAPYAVVGGGLNNTNDAEAATIPGGNNVVLVSDDAGEVAVPADPIFDGIVSRNADNLVFSGVNLQVVNGTGSTTGEVNGLGNLIVGYDESRFSNSVKTGSHNIIVGGNHNYSSFGGLVAGFENSIAGNYASVTGGSLNVANGWRSSITGGRQNQTTGADASVNGGMYNLAEGANSTVVGGNSNTSTGVGSTVLGGENTAINENFEVGSNLEQIFSGVVNRNGDTITFSGVNLQVTNGTGTTAGDVNGLGNLLIGYNHIRSSGINNRSGSHNLIVGDEQNFLSYGGLIAGKQNTLDAPYASVGGGFHNKAGQEFSSIPTGRHINTGGN